MRRKKKKENFDRYVFSIVIVAIVAIVAITSLVLFTNSTKIEGAPIYENIVEESQVPCVDNEPANDFYVAGTLQYGRIVYSDYCMNDLLHQYNCLLGNTIEILTHHCPNGCLNGVCLK